MGEVATWAQRLDLAVSRYIDGFESRFGYEPDEHRVTVVEGRDGDDLAEAVAPTLVPSRLVDLLNTVGEVSLPDVWNGYFLGPASRTKAAFAAGEPRWLAETSGRTPILVIGSDGGGNLYVTRAARESQVLRLSEVAVVDGIADPRAFGSVTVVGESVDDFLTRLLAGVEALADARGAPTF